MQIRKLASSIDLSSKSSFAWQAGAALSFGILLGTASLVFGPTLVLMGLSGVLLICLAFMTPEIVVLIILAFVLELIPRQFNISISLFVGHFFVTDLLLVILLSIVLVRLLADKSFRLVRTPLDIPLLLLCGATIVGLVTAVRNHGITFSHATPEARVFVSYFLIFFIITNLIRTRSQLARLIYGIVIIAMLIACTMVIQAMLGRSYLIFSEASSVQGEGLVRLFNPGFILCYITLIVLVCDMTLRKDYRFHSVHYLLILLLGLALLTTVARNLLVSGSIGIVVLVAILRKSELSRLAINLLIVTGIALFGITVLMMLGGGDRLLQYSTAFLDRISSMFSGTILSTHENLLFRLNEIKYAWQQIIKHPILGIGLQTLYRPAFYEGDRLTNYLHNAYLSIWLKTGLIGLISFLWFSLRFLLRGLRHWRDSQDSFFNAAILGFSLAYLGMMFSNLVAPTFVQDLSAMTFGVIMGINEVILSQSGTNIKSKQGGLHNVQS
jgi:O-antigen ligase